VVVIGNSLSPENNQAHTNQTIDMSGAVIPLMRNQRCRTPARSISIAAIVRLARLCVLIFEPNPVRHPIHIGPRRNLASSALPSAETSSPNPRVSEEHLNSCLADRLQASLTML
jgi:hypothetical protein